MAIQLIGQSINKIINNSCKNRTQGIRPSAEKVKWREKKKLRETFGMCWVGKKVLTKFWPLCGLFSSVTIVFKTTVPSN